MLVSGAGLLNVTRAATSVCGSSISMWLMKAKLLLTSHKIMQ